MTRPVPLTRLAHELLRQHLRPGDIAIDATAGNGHDTLFLAQQVGSQGSVHAYDIQVQALQTTRDRLKHAACGARVHLHETSHEHLLETLPDDYPGQISAITFNLGYLPGSDHRITTRSESTMAALQQSLKLLRRGGVLSILAYRGHPGGQEEADRIDQWCESQSGLAHETHDSPGPILHFCVRQ